MFYREHILLLLPLQSQLRLSFQRKLIRSNSKRQRKAQVLRSRAFMRQCAITSCQEGNHKDEKWCLPLPNTVTKFQLFLTDVGSDIQAMNFRDTLAMDGVNKTHKYNSKMI